MSLRTWLLFCATDTVLCLTPGPAVLLVVSQAISRGTWSGLAASLGILATNAVYFALSATGVGALLVGSSRVFLVVKWLGAIYLVWMGARMILTKASVSSAPAVAPAASTRNAFSLGIVTQGAYVATCHAARGLVGETRFARPLQRLGGAFLIAAGARLAVSRRL